VQALVEGLRGQGLDVWWDQDIAPDAPWELTIEHELAQAKVVIVAWSPAAVLSDNVRAEARRARHQGKLIQVFVEHCEPPLFFGERQGVNLHDWRGDAANHRFQTVVAATRAVLAGRPPPQGVGYAPHRRSPWRIAAPIAVGAALGLGLAANVGGVRDALCGAGALNAACQSLGFVAAPPPPSAAALAGQARQKLIQSIAGVWDRQDRSCAKPITITATTGGDGVSRITVQAAGGYASTGQVTAADNGAVISRNITAAAAGPREQWEYRPNGDEMTVLDKDGVATTLVRCPAKS